MPCFITRTLTRLETTSQHFKDEGIQNAAPTSIGDARMLAITNDSKPTTSALWNLLPYMCATYLKQDGIKIQQQNAANDVKPEIPDFFARPPLVVAFPRNTKTDKREEKLEALDFLPQSLNKYAYYRGQCTDKAIDGALEIGVLADAFSPYGTVNIYGALSLSLINRLTYAALGYLHQFSKSTTMEAFIDEDAKEAKKDTWKGDFAITKDDDIKTDGIFFPFFDGLLTPEKSYIPALIMRYFSPILGSSQKEVSKAASLIQKGWPSLCTTNSGIIISHLWKGIEMANDSQTVIRPVVLSGIYSGFILCGEKFAVMNGSDGFAPNNVGVLQQELRDRRKHEMALADLAEVISEIPPEGEETREHVSVEHLDTPRAIHAHLANRNVDIEKQQEIRNLIKSLSFQQKYWDPLSREDVAKAIHLIAEQRLPGDAAPFNLKGAAIFTKNTTMSILSAFGLFAPSLIGEGNNTVINLKTTGGPYSSLKGVTIKGVPIFKKPLQEAFEDWEKVLKSGIINFDHKGNDKNGVAKIRGLGMMIPADTSEANRILKGLRVIAESVKGKKKRAREEESDEDKRDAKRKASGSRISKEKKDNLGLSSFLGKGKGKAVDDDMSDSGDDWGF